MSPIPVVAHDVAELFLGRVQPIVNLLGDLRDIREHGAVGSRGCPSADLPDAHDRAMQENVCDLPRFPGHDY